MKIKVECCEGEEYGKAWECLRDRCPYYRKARQVVDRKWPYTGTGFGNLYGNPGHGTYLLKVRDELEVKRGSPHSSFA